MDLLSGVMHELAHTAGPEDLEDVESEDSLMYDCLQGGQRRTPKEIASDLLFESFE